jgi:anti-sigma factor RsiW
MNVTQHVVDDLLPAYFSGEASADTRALVEEYFRQDPAFELEARRAADALNAIASAELSMPDASSERAALKRAKRTLRIQAVLVAVASTFTLNAISLGFSFEVAGGHLRVHWFAFTEQRIAVAVLLALSVIFWALYFRVRRRVRTRVLG